MIQGLLLDAEQMSKRMAPFKRTQWSKNIVLKQNLWKYYPCYKNIFDQPKIDFKNLVSFFARYFIFWHFDWRELMK